MIKKFQIIVIVTIASIVIYDITMLILRKINTNKDCDVIYQLKMSRCHNKECFSKATDELVNCIEKINVKYSYFP